MHQSPPIHVVALTQGGSTPADRFRIRQNIPFLSELGVEVSSYAPFVSPSARLPGRLRKVRERYLFPLALTKTVLIAAGRVRGTIASYTADLTWIGRTYILGLEGLVRLVKGPRVLDVDDAIWMTTPFGQGAAARFARKIDAVIANNDFVADWYSQYCKSIYVVPDGIDTTLFKPLNSRINSDADKFIIGWTGTSGNFRELYDIELVLAQFLKDHPRARLRIISNMPPQFDQVPSDQFEFRRWSANTEGTDLSDLDVGIMPMRENEWTRGKNSNKMLCYMSSGLPVVVSPVGTNKKILGMGEIGLGPDTKEAWYDCLTMLFDDQNRRTIMGSRGRRIVEEYFSIQKVCAQLADIFRKIVK